MRLVLEHREMSRRLGELEAIVAGQVLAAFRDAEEIRVDTLRRLALAAEYRDDNSPEHTQRVAALAARMARHLGESDRAGLRSSARPRRCTTSARSPSPTRSCSSPAGSSRRSSRWSRRMPCSAPACCRSRARRCSPWRSRSRARTTSAGTASGYPDGLSGAGIPLVARLVHVADVFDVLVHERPYKEAWTVEDAAGEIRAGAGTQFDPGVVAAFDALGAGSWTAGMESS